MRRLRAVVLVAALVVLGGACGDSDDGGGATTVTVKLKEGESYVDRTGQPTVDIDAKALTFEPRLVKVTAGTNVVWTNVSPDRHNVLPSNTGAFEPIETDKLADEGQSASLVFDKPGEFPYYCSIHGSANNQGMFGSIQVVQG